MAERMRVYRAFTPDHGHRPGRWYWRPESFDPAEFLSPYESGYETSAEAVVAAAEFRESRAAKLLALVGGSV